MTATALDYRESSSARSADAGTAELAPAFTLLRTEVTAVARLSPRLVRVTFGGPELANMTSGGLDQRIKLVLPLPGQGSEALPGQDCAALSGGERSYQALRALPERVRPRLRSYTVRAHRPDRAEFDVDFVLHGDAGPGSSFANHAQVGDQLAVYVPNAHHPFSQRGGVEYRLDRLREDTVVIGDETALPAIGSILEALPAGVRAQVLVEIPDLADAQILDTRAELDLCWLPRGGRAPGAALMEGLRRTHLTAVDPYVWLAGESDLVKAVRRHLVHERGVEKKAITFMGYWREGRTGDVPRGPAPDRDRC